MEELNIKVLCSSLSWYVREAAYRYYGMVTPEDLEYARHLLLLGLGEVSYHDKARLLHYYVYLLNSRGILDQGLSF